MKKHTFKKSLFILLVFLSPNLVNISSEDEGAVPKLIANNEAKIELETSEIEIRQDIEGIQRRMVGLVHNAISHKYISGSSVAIYHKENLVFEVNQGIGNSTPMSIASVTKPFTSLAIMQLADAGKLKINDPISMYIPEIASRIPEIGGKEIKIRNLLQHTSGIPYSGHRQIHAAGSMFMYSNFNYRLLAKIIEKVSGLSYPNYMREKVFKPLDMEDTVISENSDGASGIVASARDLGNFANLFLQAGRRNDLPIIKSSRIKRIFKAPDFIPKGAKMAYYGLGWRVNRENNLVKLFYHTGIWNGMFADVRILPQSKSFIIQLCNPPSYKAVGFTQYQWQMNALAARYIELLDKLPTQPSASELVSIRFLKERK